jgi:hypothetical protein
VKGLAIGLMVAGVLAAAGGAVGIATNNGGSTQVVSSASPTGSVPVSPAPVPSASLSPTPSPSAAAETVQAFLPLFAAAFRSGDSAFLLAHLHPAVITLYGQQQCETYTGTLTDPTRAYRITSVSAPGTYAYSPDGRSIQVPDVLTVRVRQTAYGQKVSGPIHLAVVDGTVRWFTDCGTPQ